MKICIISIALILLILPTILCIILFKRLASLQEQVDILRIDNYDVTYQDVFRVNKRTDEVAYAAVSDKKVKEETSAAVKKADSGTNSVDEITNTAEEKSSTVSKKAEEKSVKKYKNKKVYLTFDDGPSCYTDEILDLLALYQVKATFFVLGKTDEHSKNMYQRILEDGHTLGMHSYSHEYKKIYKSVEDFDKDFTKLSDLLYDTTGYRPNIYRFPGGSSNSYSESLISDFVRYLNDKSIIYYDWNVVSGDATGESLTPDQLYENVISGIDKNKRSIVLMHDTAAKENTVKSLVHILQTLTDEGADILPIDETVAPIQQVKNSLSE